MADANIKLRVLLEAAGIKPTAKQLDKLSKDLTETAAGFGKVSNAANKTKRNLEGVAQRSGSTAKDFSRMSQGMGGLVQAYATIAANVFALSSAFLVLRRAADLSSMIKSAENFSDRFGVSVTRITKRMQEASGGALDFAEALPSINKAVSAGVGIEQMEQLTVAATKASQTFGGSATEALNRFISASQRGRVEIIQTLGVVIKTEQAYKEYAATIGKTALELSAYDRQQAILLATIEASNKVFAGVDIDPNPFTQFATTMVDVKDNILTTITDGITPLISSFNQSKNAAVALMAFIAASVGSKVFPQLTALLSGFTAASIKSTAAAKAASIAAMKQREQANKEAGKTTGKTTEKVLRKQLKAEEMSYAKRKAKHAAFKESIFKKNGEVNAKVLNQQKAHLRRQEEAILKGKGIQKNLSSDLPTIRKQIDARVRLGQVTNAVNTSEKLANQTRARSTTIIKQLTAATKQYYASTKAVLVGLRSGITTGFSKSFQTMQTNVSLGIKKMIIQWKLFGKTIGTTGTNSLKKFSEAFGRTVGVVAGGISRLISGLTSFLIVFSLIRLGWELYGDQIRGISKEQRELLNSFQDLGESFKEVTDSNTKFIGSMYLGEQTLANFISQAEFLRGTFDSMIVSVNDFNAALFRATGNNSIESLSTYFTDAEKTLKNLRDDITKERAKAPSVGIDPFPDSFAAATFKIENKDLEETVELTEKLGINIDNFRKALDEASKISLKPIVNNLGSTLELLNATGLEGFSDVLIGNVTANLSKLGDQGKLLTELFKEGNYLGLIAAIEAIEDSGQRAAALQALANASKDVAIQGKSISANFVASGRALEETNRNMQTYISGIEKARAASVPNKTIFNLLLDTERALTDLDNAAQRGTKKKLEDLIGAPDLALLREFIDIDKDITFDEALKKVNKELEVYNAVILDSVNNAGLFKVIANETFKLKNEEVSTDERQIEIIKELEALEIRRATLSKTTAQNKLNVAIKEEERLVRLGDLNSLAYIDALAVVRTLKAEVQGHQDVIDAINQRKNAERSRAEQIKKDLLALQSTNNIFKQLLGIEKKLASNRQQTLAINTRLIKLQKIELNLKKDLILQQIANFDINKVTSEQDANQLMIFQAQLDVIEAQNRELERRALINKANAIEQDSDRFFSKESIENMAEIFTNALATRVNKLKPFMVTLANGFVDTINGGVDAAIDKLFEGHGFSGFKDAVVEALKAGLRETFAEAFKNEIMKGIGALFNLKSAEQKQEARHKELMMKMDNWIEAINANTTAQGGAPSTNVGTTVQSAANNLFGNPLDILKKGFEGDSDKGPDPKDVKKTAKTNEENVKINEEGNIIAQLIGQQTSGLLSTMIATLVTGFTSMITASLFPIATGGVVKGGMGSITPMANGGITRGPNLALIGEGRNDEAVVPLPNNREIPVDLQGATGDTINIEQNFDFRNADNSAIPILRQEARAIEERTFNRVFSEINKGGKYARIVGRR